MQEITFRAPDDAAPVAAEPDDVAEAGPAMKPSELVYERCASDQGF